LDEFYRIAFRKKIDHSIDELQAEPGRLVGRVQLSSTASGPLVLRQDPDAHLP
jgi:hypothetical protein